ncbi:MAG: ferric reductase-like transmembrane domain-containing protein [Pseudomonadota bacterium]
MAASYKAVGWAPFKRRYDFWMLAGIALYLAAFVGGTIATAPPGETWAEIQILIRAFGSLAFIMLTFILMIGPLARLTPRFKPFLFNRRHLGVATFLVALVHSGLVVLWYHGFSSVNPLASLLASNPNYGSLQGFPFESLGVIALFILFVMAATSHDFWNANLGPGLWKAIHMSVYVAYALLVAHVMLGAIQLEKSPLYAGLVAASAALVVLLHLASSFASNRSSARAADWIKVADLAEMEDGRAKIVAPAKGERIAVFLYDGKISAVSNVCRHQGGPLGEGRVIDGCITCPWHGYQYLPDSGRSPPPFTEKIATYAVKIEGGAVYVDPSPNAPGTEVAPARVEGAPA